MGGLGSGVRAHKKPKTTPTFARLTDVEKLELKRLADRRGLTLAKYIHDVVIWYASRQESVEIGSVNRILDHKIEPVE